MSVHRDPRQDSLLSLASWGEPAEMAGQGPARAGMSRAGDIAETGPSIAELLRRRAQGEPSMQAVADPASSDQYRPAAAPLEQVRSVPVRRERPAATAPAAHPVAAPARKSLLSRVGAMLSRGGDARTRQAAEAAPAASMPPVLHAAPLASPDMSIVSEPAAPASEADIMAGYFSRLPADTTGVVGGEPDAWPVHAAPGSAVVPPAMPVAAPSYRAPPVHLLPVAPVIPLPSAHPAAPWQPVGMPTPA